MERDARSHRERTAAFADGRRKRCRLNHSPLFLDFLEGKTDFACTAGIPSYSVFGWPRPCWLMSNDRAKTYRELVETTDWAKFGPAVRQLHGVLRLRAHRGAGHHGLVQAVAARPGRSVGAGAHD
jgi:Domain of unknown function (DUF3463)